MIEFLVGLVALIFVGGFINAYRQSNAKRLADDERERAKQEHQIQINAWRAAWEPTVDRTRWIPKSKAASIIERFPPPQNQQSTLSGGGDSRTEKELFLEFTAHNLAFLATQKKRLKPFFDSVEKNPLTPEQMDGCICMDDAVQIVAAAGSSKTSTMVARVGYALHEGIVRPDQILLLAFNRSVAEELQTRIKERLAGFEGIEAVTVKTFNAFGLGVIGSATKRKPTLAAWAEPGRDVTMILEIIHDLRQRDTLFRVKWDIFRTIYGRDIGSFDTPTEPNAIRNGKRGILTAKANTSATT